MKFLFFIFLACTGLLAETVQLPKGIDHRPFDRLLKQYVNDQGLVDYQGWKNSPTDTGILEDYLKQFESSKNPAEGDEKIAGLLNAYNAFTLKFILENYPTDSIRLLDDPFNAQRHLVGGRKVSLDDIEHDTLRPLIGWKVHALVVCAARSCPPLSSEAFTVNSWEDQMKERYRVWLAREDLNTFYPEKNRAEISKIFDWYKKDFTGENNIHEVLVRFGPGKAKQLYSQNSFTRSPHYKKYHWGLNDQSDLGKDYKHSIFKSLF